MSLRNYEPACNEPVRLKISCVGKEDLTEEAGGKKKEDYRGRNGWGKRKRSRRDGLAGRLATISEEDERWESHQKQLRI